MAVLKSLTGFISLSGALLSEVKPAAVFDDSPVLPVKLRNDAHFYSLDHLSDGQLVFQNYIQNNQSYSY